MPCSTNDNWLVVCSKPAQEARAEYNLRRQIADVFCPRIRIFGKTKALFPSYLFVRVANHMQIRLISNTYGVRTLVKIGENIATVANDEINEIRSRAPYCPFKAGDNVVYGSIPAIFEEMIDDDRCRVLFSMLGKSGHKVLRLADLAPCATP